MVNQQLLDFIKQQQAAGKNREEITAMLKTNGWKDEDIAQGFTQISNGTSVPTPLPGPVAILTEAWNLYNQNFWLYVGTYAITIIAPLILLIPTIFALSYWPSKTIPQQNITTFIVIAVISLAVILFLSIWGQTSLLIAIRDSEQGMTLQKAYRTSLKYIGSYFVVSLVMGIISAIGFILLFVPGLIFVTWYFFAPYSVISGDAKGFAALSYSKSLVNGRFWEVFGRLAFGIALTILINLLVQSAVSALHFGNFGTVLANILSLFWIPLFFIYSFLLFRHLQNSR